MRRLARQQVGGLKPDKPLRPALIHKSPWELCSVRRKIEIEKVCGIGKCVKHRWRFERRFQADNARQAVVMHRSPQRPVLAAKD